MLLNSRAVGYVSQNILGKLPTWPQLSNLENCPIVDYQLTKEYNIMFTFKFVRAFCQLHEVNDTVSVIYV